MKVIRTTDDLLVFEIGAKEKALLLNLLGRYPLVPGTHHQLSRKGAADARAENQKLLEESLAAHRDENRRQLNALLNEAACFQPVSEGFHWTLRRPELEWLLQVLNDLRVGSWIALGSPDTQSLDAAPLDAQTAPHYWLMEAAALFQMFLLEALNQPSSGK